MHYYITFWLQTEAIQKVVKRISRNEICNTGNTKNWI